MSTTRFVVKKTSDLTASGMLCYGDAIWLQAGVFDVLGAQYGSGPISLDSKREIQPSLVSCRRKTMAKVLQYISS